MHKFDPKEIHKLESPERREKFPPDVIAEQLSIEEGSVVADIGCGSGIFTIPIAEKAGKNGKVYAVDISEEMLDILREKISDKKNIEPVLSGENEFKINSNSVDLVFLAFILHEAIDRELFISKSIDLLKSSGRIAILDYEKKETESGPPVRDRISKEEVQEILNKNGFSIVDDMHISHDVYFMVFSKIFKNSKLDQGDKN